ncbi:MAG: hypothetical protein Q8Q36_01800 [bacterium]|nr:hypothetical protein [bacterium]
MQKRLKTTNLPAKVFAEQKLRRASYRSRRAVGTPTEASGLQTAPRGFGLVEVVLGSGIVTAALFGILTVASQSLRVSDRALREVQATFLLEEGAEAIRSMRDRGWENIAGLSTTTAHFLSFSTSTPARFATTSENSYIDGMFLRSFTVASVRRDGSDRIAASGALDPGTRKFTVEVAWQERGATTTKSLEFYLSDI